MPFTLADLESIVSNFQQFTGRAGKQTEEFLQEVVRPRLEPFRDILGTVDAALSV
jgi:adenylosuccinate lyase